MSDPKLIENLNNSKDRYSIRILFFASLKEKAGTRELRYEIPSQTSVNEFKEILRRELPGISDAMDSALIAINKEFAFDDEMIPDQAEVALFPPVSGGVQSIYQTVALITEDEIDLNDLVAMITYPTTGATCIFTGMVRGVTTRGEGHQTAYLEYEAYKSMAEEKMNQVANEMRRQWKDVQGIVMVQRIGKLGPGTPTVLVGCSAAHRDTGVFEATRYGIDRLKEIVPVWKKEFGPGGETWVEGNYRPQKGD